MSSVIVRARDIPERIERNVIYLSEELTPKGLRFVCINPGARPLDPLTLPIAQEVRDAMMQESRYGVVVYITNTQILLAFDEKFSYGKCIIVH